VATFFLSIHSQNNINLAIEEVAKIPNVSFITKFSGDYELQICVLVRELDELTQANEKIIQLPCIEKIEANIGRVPPKWPGPRQYITTF
jgi:hypothetical protein